MTRLWGMIAGLTGALAVTGAALVPAMAAPGDRLSGRSLLSSRAGIGTFTPAAADPKLAALLARTGTSSSGFRFTPVAAVGRGRAVTVAVRARSGNAFAQDRLALGGTGPVGIAPVSYNLGAGVGWKRFAVSGDVKRVDTGVMPGSREGADVAVSYNAAKWSTRLQVAADRPIASAPRTIAGGESVALDLGGSYRLSRNLDVTAGVRYKAERNRLEALADNRRDSQAIYVGTAFRF